MTPWRHSDDIRIDIAYARHHGTRAAENPSRYTSCASSRRVRRAWWPLDRSLPRHALLKNELIETFIRLHDAASVRKCRRADTGDSYISPAHEGRLPRRLNASALLNHRGHVTNDDLYALK